jgi:hypothetical protein
MVDRKKNREGCSGCYLDLKSKFAFFLPYTETFKKQDTNTINCGYPNEYKDNSQGKKKQSTITPHFVIFAICHEQLNLIVHGERGGKLCT